MAKIYDLSQYLSSDQPKIKLEGKEYLVNDGFNDILKLDALLGRKEEMSDIAFFKEFLSISLGEEAATELMAKNYRMRVYKRIMSIVQEVYAGDGDDQEDVSQS